MSEMDQTKINQGPKTISLPVERELSIQVLQGGWVMVDGVMCGGAAQFHETLKARLKHPFAEAPKPPRKPRAPKPETEKPAAKPAGKK